MPVPCPISRHHALQDNGRSQAVRRVVQRLQAAC